MFHIIFYVLNSVYNRVIIHDMFNCCHFRVIALKQKNPTKKFVREKLKVQDLILKTLHFLGPTSILRISLDPARNFQLAYHFSSLRAFVFIKHPFSSLCIKHPVQRKALMILLN